MPLPSAFSPYGAIAFSSRETRVRKIYDSLMEGASEAYATDGAFAAEMYAIAREVAAAQATLDRVGNHRNPLKASELLPDLERDYGIVPAPNATLAARRQALADKQYLAFGARRQAVVDGVTNIVGESGFVAYRVLDTTEASPYPTDPAALPGHNVFRPAGSTVKLFTMVHGVSLLGTQNMLLHYVAGDQSDIRVGELLVFEIGRLGLEETLEVEAATIVGSYTSVQVTFAKAHGAGFYVRSGTWPRWISDKRWNMVVLSDDAFADATLVAKVHEFLRGALRGVSTWTVMPETTAGHVGPFEIGVGLLGVTPIDDIEL